MGERSPNQEPHGQVSLRDVGARAGVSFQTVSKVLRNKGSISAATRARVLAAAEELGYVPNSLARGLAVQRTMSIGFLASGLASFVLGPMLLGAEQEARRHGYFTLFSFVDNSVENAVQILQQLIERRVDGIISAAAVFADNESYSSLLRSSVLSVATHSVVGGGVPIVGEDGETTGYLAAKHVVKLRHQRIAVVTGWGDNNRNSRLDGNKKALAEAGLKLPSNYVLSGDWTMGSGYRAISRLLDSGEDIPTAIIAHNDHMAMGIIRALKIYGLRIPEDVSVIGCDNIDIARFSNPPLTTVNISFESTGVMAVRTLLNRISGEVTTPERIVLPCEIVIRDSTGPAPV